MLTVIIVAFDLIDTSMYVDKYMCDDYIMLCTIYPKGIYVYAYVLHFIVETMNTLTT